VSTARKWVISGVAFVFALFFVVAFAAPEPDTTSTMESPRRPIAVEVTPTPVSPPLSVPTPDVVIPASAPTRLEIPVIGLDGAITEYTLAMIMKNGGYDPQPWRTAIAWDTSIEGGLAGTDATNTVYLYGHSWIEETVFNGIRYLQVGDIARVTTANGTLCYVAHDTFTVRKGDYKSHPELTRAVPNRLVLVTCNRPDGYDPNSVTIENAVVILQLDQQMTNAGC